jgi:phosphoribosylglycinamide formyltransferase
VRSVVKRVRSCAHTATGSNLQALLDAAGSSSLPGARVTQVLSNRKAAYGLERAKNAGVPSATLSLSPWLKAHPGSSRDDYDGLLAQAVLAGGEGKSEEVLAAAREGAASSSSAPATALPDLVVLAGFMHIVSSAFLAPLRRAGVPVINLHPALPTQFDGVDAIGRAWRAFQDGTLKDGKTGVMVHEVIEEVDRGAPIVVREVPCREGESLEELETRIHQVEHEIIVEATREMLQRKQR